jgi:hypothetical protein
MFAFFYTFLLYAKFAGLILCGVALIWFPDDYPLGIETYTSVQRDIII